MQPPRGEPITSTTHSKLLSNDKNTVMFTVTIIFRLRRWIFRYYSGFRGIFWTCIQRIRNNFLDVYFGAFLPDLVLKSNKVRIGKDGSNKHRTYTHETAVWVPCENKSPRWLILTCICNLSHLTNILIWSQIMIFFYLFLFVFPKFNRSFVALSQC